MGNSLRDRGPGEQWLGFIFIWWGIVLMGSCPRTIRNISMNSSEQQEIVHCRHKNIGGGGGALAYKCVTHRNSPTSPMDLTWHIAPCLICTPKWRHTCETKWRILIVMVLSIIP